MDLILGTFADAHLANLGARELDMFEAMLAENDQDLYAWVTGRATPPERYAPLVIRLGRRPATDQ